MNIETKTFNKAFSIFQEFGPKRSIPREERIKAKFPELQDDVISQLVEKYKEIESFDCVHWRPPSGGEPYLLDPEGGT